MPKKASSVNSEKDPYSRGFTFWKDNTFWRSPKYTAKSQAYYDNWLEEMRLKERSLIRLS